MIDKLLQNKHILQQSPLFDGPYFTKAYGKRNELQTVAAEVRYLNEKSLWFSATSGMFNGQYYVFQDEDLKSLSYPPIIHYITNGYFEARKPSALIDIDYLVSQIIEDELPQGDAERHAVKVDVLKRYSGIYDLLITSGKNPNYLFDNEYFCEANNIKISDLEIPVHYYYVNSAHSPLDQKVLETTPLFSMKKYLDKNEDLRKAEVNPLEHLLTHGLREKRLMCIEDLISQSFLDNTADLYQDDRYKDHEYFLSKSLGNGQLAGARWATKYSEVKHPAFTSGLSNKKTSKVTVGTVLFNNSKSELMRLKNSIDKERECSENTHINDLFFVNDIDNLERYEDVFGAEKVIPSELGNIGFGSGHNALMERAFPESDYYFGINPDGCLIQDCVQSLVEFSRYYKDSTLLEANILPLNHPKWHDPVLFDTKWVSGAAFFLHRGLWEDVGGFDQDMHMYCEDVDFSWRVKAAGYSLKVCPTASFFHDVTSRNSVDVDDAVESNRKKSMLTGAYYLAVKWQATDIAEQYHETLLNENLILPNQKLVKPAQLIPKSVSEEVADFSYGLRFSPSRFW